MHTIQAGEIHIESYEAQQPSNYYWQRVQHKVRVRVGGSAIGAKHRE